MPRHAPKDADTRACGRARAYGLLLIGCATVLVLASPASAQRGYHVEPVLGFKVKVPSKWQRFPVEKDRRFVRGHYVSQRSYPIRGERFTHRPAMRVIVLPDRPAQEPGAVEPIVEYYANYKDYLVRNVSGALTDLSDVTGTVSGMPCRKLTIRRQTGRSYRIIARVFHVGAHRVVVEFHVLEAQFEKIRKQITACLRSAQWVAPRASRASAPRATLTPTEDLYRPPLWLREPARWSKQPYRARRDVRARYEKEFFATVTRDILPGWRKKVTPHFLVLSQATARYTADVIKVAEASRNWCDANLDAASDEYVMKAVIRIFANRADYGTYRVRSRRTGHYVPQIREIVIRERREPARGVGAVFDLHQGIVQQFLVDKDPALHRNLPRWFRAGLGQYLRMSYPARGKLTFEVTDFEKTTIERGLRGRDLETVQAIVHQTTKQQDETDRRLRIERGRVMRFALARKSAFPAGFLGDYLVAVRAAASAFGIPPGNPGAGRVPARTDDQSEATLEAPAEKRKQLLDAVNQVVCGWDVTQWTEVQTAYRRFNRQLLR